MASTLTFADPVTWDRTKTYEVNLIVFVGRKAYTALKNVPANTAIDNTEYWKETGVPNSGDISALESVVGNSSAGLVKDVADNTNDIDSLESDMDNVKFTLYTPTS